MNRKSVLSWSEPLTASSWTSRAYEATGRTAETSKLRLGRNAQRSRDTQRTKQVCAWRRASWAQQAACHEVTRWTASHLELVLLQRSLRESAEQRRRCTSAACHGADGCLQHEALALFDPCNVRPKITDQHWHPNACVQRARGVDAAEARQDCRSGQPLCQRGIKHSAVCCRGCGTTPSILRRRGFLCPGGPLRETLTPGVTARSEARSSGRGGSADRTSRLVVCRHGTCAPACSRPAHSVQHGRSNSRVTASAAQHTHLGHCSDAAQQ
jgi:hypothetical protein